MDKLKILSFNVRGLRDKSKRLKIFNYLKKLRPNIVYLCEAHLLEHESNQIKNEWGLGEIFINENTERSAGQVILLNGVYDILTHNILVKGRCHSLEIKIKSNKLNLINIYAPNRDSEQEMFYNKLRDISHNICLSEGYIIFGGDFNIVQCVNKDKSNRVKMKENALKL